MSGNDGGDVKTETPATEAAARPTLTVILDGKQKAYDLPEHGALTIGRAPTNDVVVNHTSVSRAHVVVRIAGDVSIEDLGSGNGTRVNGAKLEPNRAVAVPPGALVEVGSALIVLHGLDRRKAEAKASTTAAATLSVDQWVALVASSEITVLLLGETGVGKGVVAEAIHRGSARASCPLLALNCGALTETLLEAELFGYERGAFTGATSARPGLLEAAEGGTVFLDEVGDLSGGMQVKLLRVLEDREVIRVGGRKATRIDVRFVAATNRDLDAMVAIGSFRRDLLYRLNAIVIRVPPLRERRAEIPSLARHLSAALARGRPITISEDALAALYAHDWPGNVRELRNVLERALLLSRGDPITREHVTVGDTGATPSSSTGPLRDAVTDFERSRVIEALDRAAGNQTRAAAALGVSRRTLVRWLDELKLPRPRKNDAS